jgi:hypothetical protein
VVSSGCRWRRRDGPDGPFPDHVPLPLHGSRDHRSGRQGPAWARERPLGLLTSAVRRARHAQGPSRPVRRRRSPAGSHRPFGCCALRSRGIMVGISRREGANRVRSYLCMGLFCDFLVQALPCTAEATPCGVRNTGCSVPRALRGGPIHLQRIMLWPRR